MDKNLSKKVKISIGNQDHRSFKRSRSHELNFIKKKLFNQSLNYY